MKRAKVIKAEQQRRKALNDNIFPLEMFIDSVYKRYLELCYICNEVPLTKGKWLFEEVEVYKPIEGQTNERT